MTNLICKFFGHAEATYHFGTSESGCILKRCMRCNEGRVHSSWNVPEMEEWPKVYLTTEEMQELITGFRHD